MLVIKELYLPIMFVKDVWCASMLESDTKTAGVSHQLDVPFLEGDVMVKLTHLLRVQTQDKT